MKTLLLLCLFASSCTSVFKQVSYAPENEYPKADRAHALVYFMRPNVFSGSSAKWIVTETREKTTRNIGIFTSGSYFYRALPPGDVVFEVIDPGWEDHIAYKKLRLESGRTYYLSLVTDGDGMGSSRYVRTGLIENNSINRNDELEAMRMVDLKASKKSWE